MELTVKGCVFVAVDNKQKKDGSGSYRVLRVGDPFKYENIEIYCDDSLNGANLKPGDNCVVRGEIYKQGYNLRAVAKEVIAVSK